jgi:hypothetical protein
MSRPDTVRCGTCCYWDPYRLGEREPDEGMCHRHVAPQKTMNHHWCGEHRAEWHAPRSEEARDKEAPDA